MSSSWSAGVGGAGSGVTTLGTFGVGLCPGVFRAEIYHDSVSVTRVYHVVTPTSFRSLICSF